MDQHPDGGVLACAFEDGDVVPGRAVYTYPDAYGVPARGAIRTTRFQTPASARAAIDALGESRALFGNFDAAAREVAHPVRVAFWGGATHERANAKEYESTRDDAGVPKANALVEWLCGGSTKTTTTAKSGSDPHAFVVWSRGECSEPLESATLASIRDESGDGDAIGEVRVRGDVIIPAGGLVAFVHGERRAVAAGTSAPAASLGWRAPDGWRRSRSGSGSGSSATLGRWRPDGQRAFYLRANDDDSEDEYDDEDGREPSLGGGGAGGIFLFGGSVLGGVPSSNRGVRGDSRALRRARPADVPSRKVSTPAPRRDVGARRGASPRRRRGGGATPDYEGGWRVCPVSEAGYYRHLARTPPAVIRERSGAAGVGDVRVMEHGPWRVVWLDTVEQGLAYRDAIASAEGRFAHDPHAIGFEYVRAMATVGLRRWDRRRDVPRKTPCASDSAREPSPRFSVLCWDDDGAARWRLRRRSRTSRESVSASASRTTAEGTFPHEEKATRRRDALLDRN